MRGPQTADTGILDALIAGLNDMPTMSTTDGKLWHRVEYILVHALADGWGSTPEERHALAPFLAQVLEREKPSFATAAGHFNTWAAVKPVPLSVQLPCTARRTKEVETEVGSPLWNREQQIIFWLWTFFRQPPEVRRRIKWCVICRRWFRDRTRNTLMIRCSTACTNHYWTLDRRRQAGHDVPAAPKRQRRRAKA